MAEDSANRTHQRLKSRRTVLKTVPDTSPDCLPSPSVSALALHPTKSSHDGAATHEDAPLSPNSGARACMALRQNSMCASSSTPSSRAPLSMSSRLTERANDL